MNSGDIWKHTVQLSSTQACNKTLQQIPLGIEKSKSQYCTNPNILKGQCLEPFCWISTRRLSSAWEMFLRHVQRDLAYCKRVCAENNPALAKRSPFNPTGGPIQVRKREEVGKTRQQALNTALLTLYIGTSGSLFCFCILVSTGVLIYVHYFYTVASLELPINS